MLFDSELLARFVFVLSLVLICGRTSNRIWETSGGMTLSIVRRGAGPTVFPGMEIEIHETTAVLGAPSFFD